MAAASQAASPPLAAKTEEVIRGISFKVGAIIYPKRPVLFYFNFLRVSDLLCLSSFLALHFF
jgi:hypothetical protein